VGTFAFSSKFQRRMNNHHIQIAELALDFFQVFWSFFQYKNGFKDNKMHANPDKFQVLAVGEKTFAKNPSNQIQNNILSCEETVKLLGIDIDYQFNQHISNLCRKASQQLNVLI
jgi:hypothetical protein